VGTGRRAPRCLHTQILSLGTQRAKENGAEGMGETGGEKVADAGRRHLIQATDNARHRRAISACNAPMASSRVAHSSVSRRWASPTSALVQK
jgi:hypothetical protein